ncbi:MAG: tetratricopeptide repeat protein [Acidobacteriota bacterium]|nr:tetratricopeptide repeat protein [Acidobacteriota bacterium]
MRATTFRYAAAALLCCVFAAPAAAQDREQLQMLAELRMIQEQSGQLRALIANLEETLKALNAKLDQQADSTRKGFADQKLQIDGLRDGVGVVREKLDDTNVRISTLSHEVATMRSTFATMQVQPSQTAEPPATGDPAAPPAANPPAGAPATPPTGMSAQRLFETAMADYFGIQYDLAIAGFEGYLRTYSTAPDAAQAQYYVGESNYQLKRYQEAVTAYGRVITNFKDSRWVAEALYKQGRAFEELKEFDRARQAYDAVMKNYADTNAALLAKQRLQALPR